MKRVCLLLFVAIIVFASDMLTKLWIERRLQPGDYISVVGEEFRLILTYNTGVAFGILSAGGVGLSVLIGTIIVSLMGWAIYTVYDKKSPHYAYLPLGLLLGGAVGNFVDRMIDGRVTDFLDVGLTMWRWPTFNLADCAITVGVTWLVLFWHPREPSK